MDRILNDESQLEAFIEFTREFKANADVLFIMQVEQIKNIAVQLSEDELNDQVEHVLKKHIEKHAPLPISLVNVSKRIQEKAKLEDLVWIQQKIKLELEHRFVDAFLTQKMRISNENALPAFKEVLKVNSEYLKPFVLFLMKDSRHQGIGIFCFGWNCKTLKYFARKRKNYLKIRVLKKSSKWRKFTKNMYRWECFLKGIQLIFR
jgi:hypothetical protein